LADLIKGASAALLLVACYRSEEAASSPLLRCLIALRATYGGAFSSVDLALEELDPPQAAELAAGLLEEAVTAWGQGIAREAHGNPFFIGELVRFDSGGFVDAVKRLVAPEATINYSGIDFLNVHPGPIPPFTFPPLLKNLKFPSSIKAGGLATLTGHLSDADGDQKLTLTFTAVGASENGLCEYVYPLKTEGKAAEVLEASEGRGGAVKKREEVHRMAEANKAFSHFRF
jgi:small subunit ribosomal protein S7